MAQRNRASGGRRAICELPTWWNARSKRSVCAIQSFTSEPGGALEVVPTGFRDAAEVKRAIEAFDDRVNSRCAGRL
jgi:hypothetical protein